MNIFGSKLGSLSARSAEATGLFTRVVNKLKAVNEESRTEQEKNQLEVNRLNEENTQLAILETENRKVIDKIEQFLGQ